VCEKLLTNQNPHQNHDQNRHQNSKLMSRQQSKIVNRSTHRLHRTKASMRHNGEKCRDSIDTFKSIDEVRLIVFFFQSCCLFFDHVVRIGCK
jgi:hypothetical protein